MAAGSAGGRAQAAAADVPEVGVSAGAAGAAGAASPLPGSLASRRCRQRGTRNKQEATRVEWRALVSTTKVGGGVP